MSNFLSVGNSPVRISLNSERSTLICGGNGTGKTTVLDALNYACFNKPLRDVKLAQLVNSINKKKCIVKLNFTINGDNYEVHRGQKPALFVIHKNGDEINQNASARDLQQKLETEILGTNFRTFNQVVVMASTGYVHFMEMGTSDRRVVVEQMLDIEIIGHMSTVLKDRIKEVRMKSGKISDNYRDLTRSIEETKKLIEQAKTMGDAEVERIDSNIKTLDSTIAEIESELAKLKEEHDVQVNSKPLVDRDYETERHRNASNEINRLQTLNDELNNKINENNSTFRVVENEKMNLARDISSNEKVINFYEDHDHCNVCRQPIDDEFKKNIIAEHKATNEALVSNISTLEIRQSSINDESISFNDTVHAHKQEISQQNNIIEQVKQIVQSLKDWQNGCDKIINKAKMVQQRLKDQLDNKSRLIENKNEVLSKGNVDTKEYYDTIDKLNVDIEALIKNRAEVEEEMELCKLCEEMLKDKGLKAKIIKQFLPVINQSINFFLEAMNANYSFVLDEHFNETIKSRYRDNFSYGSFSNGQRMRINVALLFMWRKLAESKNTVSSNLLFMDEVLDSSLDKEGIDMLFDVFETMPKTNIFIVSHRPEIVDRFDKVIEVSMNGNFSHYGGLDES